MAATATAPPRPTNSGALQFAAALVLLGVVMFALPPQVAPWLGAVLVLGALTAAESHAPPGQGPIADFRRAFLGG